MTDTGNWQTAVFKRIERRTPRLSSFFLHAPLAPHTAGQHVDVRLTAPDGYQARRSYSIASAPGRRRAGNWRSKLLDDGEVSGWFHEVAQPGDTLDVRGPLGGHFVWTPVQPGPLLLAGGGSGIVPLVSIVRAWADAGAPVPLLLLHSARTWDSLAYRDELQALANAHPALHYVTAVTRGAAPRGYLRRVDAALLGEARTQWGHAPATAYVCGANGFVETVAQLLVDARVAPRAIRTERYGG